jgi:uncharacterized membrane protein YhaH (DUF805 family)
MFCSQCGYKLSNDAKFCINCGSPTTDVVPVVEIKELAVAENKPPSRRMTRSIYIINILLSGLSAILGIIIFLNNDPASILFAILIYAICCTWQIASGVRRLHDFGRSGWWTVLFLVPIANLILLAFCVFKKGDSGSNKYGESPLKVATV